MKKGEPFQARPYNAKVWLGGTPPLYPNYSVSPSTRATARSSIHTSTYYYLYEQDELMKNYFTF
jgi:hypothetical protein